MTLPFVVSYSLSVGGAEAFGKRTAGRPEFNENRIDRDCKRSPTRRHELIMQTTLTNMTCDHTTSPQPSTILATGSCAGLKAWYFQEACAQLCELRISARSRELARLPGFAKVRPARTEHRTH